MVLALRSTEPGRICWQNLWAKGYIHVLCLILPILLSVLYLHLQWKVLLSVWACLCCTLPPHTLQISLITYMERGRSNACMSNGMSPGTCQWIRDSHSFRNVDFCLMKTWLSYSSSFQFNGVEMSVVSLGDSAPLPRVTTCETAPRSGLTIIWGCVECPGLCICQGDDSEGFRWGWIPASKYSQGYFQSPSCCHVAKGCFLTHYKGLWHCSVPRAHKWGFLFVYLAFIEFNYLHMTVVSCLGKVLHWAVTFLLG